MEKWVKEFIGKLQKKICGKMFSLLSIREIEIKIIKCFLFCFFLRRDIVERLRMQILELDFLDLNYSFLLFVKLYN